MKIQMAISESCFYEKIADQKTIKNISKIPMTTASVLSVSSISEKVQSIQRCIIMRLYHFSHGEANSGK